MEKEITPCTDEVTFYHLISYEQMGGKDELLTKTDKQKYSNVCDVKCNTATIFFIYMYEQHSN